MAVYIIKRIIMAVVTVWLVATITFFLMFTVPGGPFLSEKAVSPAAQAAMEAKYGLDKPVMTQYFTYLASAARGDFGDSIKQRGRKVSDIIHTKFAVSAGMGCLAIATAFAVGVTMGVIAAYNRGGPLDRLISVISTMGVTVPSFVICTLLLYVCGVKLRILPTLGLMSPLHYIMPVTALALYPAAYIMRLMRSSMIEVLDQDYMRTARAKGVSEGAFLFKHALRNAVLPVITYLGPLIAYILTGSFVVERIFTIPGLGGSFITSITSRDYTLIMGTTIFLANFVVVMNMAVDIIYKIVDPRINFK